MGILDKLFGNSRRKKEEDKYKDYYPFDKIISKMRKFLGDEVFETIGKHAGFTLNDSGEININITPSQEQLLVHFFTNYKKSYALCKSIAKLEKISFPKVIDEMIFNLHKFDSKTSNFIDNLSGPSGLAAHILIDNYSFMKNTFAYEEGFELGAFDEGILASSESIFNRFLEGAKGLDDINDKFKDEVSGFLDTFGYGLFLKKEFKPSIMIYNKSIELSSNHPNIAEHLTNRGKSKLKLDDKEGAKSDFEKALEKDENFEEAKNLLESIGK